MKFKRLIPALAMLLVSAILLGTSTFAWFSMNTLVSATSMQVRAVAEQGLLINEVNTSNSESWDNEATAKQTSTNPALLYPSSTANGTTWYHAASTSAHDAAAATDTGNSANLLNNQYTTLGTLQTISSMSKTTASAGDEALREVKGTATDAPAGYYVHYQYFLKSSSSQISLATDLSTAASGAQYIKIKSVTATEPTTKASADLNKSLRVGIKLNSAFYIYAPVTGFTATYYVGGTTETTAVSGATETATDLATLPATTANGAPVDVYIWYEGEDENCMTDNATAVTLDNINVDIVFELATKA